MNPGPWVIKARTQQKRLCVIPLLCALKVLLLIMNISHRTTLPSFCSLKMHWNSIIHNRPTTSCSPVCLLDLTLPFKFTCFPALPSHLLMWKWNCDSNELATMSHKKEIQEKKSVYKKRCVLPVNLQHQLLSLMVCHSPWHQNHIHKVHFSSGQEKTQKKTNEKAMSLLSHYYHKSLVCDLLTNCL